eukprot:7413452-Pyramimonas_sp.AAC.1
MPIPRASPRAGRRPRALRARAADVAGALQIRRSERSECAGRPRPRRLHRLRPRSAPLQSAVGSPSVQARA